MYTMIVVDDEIAIREGIINLFPWEDNGFKVIEHFSNGQQALDFLSTHTVDVILTDIRMPIMNGIELSGHLAKKYPDIRFVFLTGFQDFSYMRTAIQHHASDYLLKPIKYEELFQCFDKIKKELDEKNHINEPVENVSYYGKIISKVCNYLQESFKTATLEEAASIVNLSPNYLSKIFKENASISFSEYLNNIRMEKAAQMLSDIQYKHYEIAYYIGYDNPKNFSRAFKQYYKISPREYREQHLK